MLYLRPYLEIESPKNAGQNLFPTCSVAAVMAALSGIISAAMISFIDAIVAVPDGLCQEWLNFTIFRLCTAGIELKVTSQKKIEDFLPKWVNICTYRGELKLQIDLKNFLSRF